MVAIRHGITRTGVALFALLLGACDARSNPGQAVIQSDGLSHDLGAFCTTEERRGCAHAVLDVTYVGDGTSILRVRLRNLEGTHPHDNTGGWRLSYLAFGTRERAGNSAGMASFGLSGAVGSYGTPDLSYPFDPIASMVPDTGETSAPGIVLAWHNATQTHGLVGCTQVPLDTAATSYPFRGAWQTCPSQGFDGEFNVAIRMSWELQDVDQLFVNWAGPGADGTLVNCDSRIAATCVAVPGSSSVRRMAASPPRARVDPKV